MVARLLATARACDRAAGATERVRHRFPPSSVPCAAHAPPCSTRRTCKAHSCHTLSDDGRYAHLLPPHWDAIIPQWLQEVRRRPASLSHARRTCPALTTAVSSSARSRTRPFCTARPLVRILASASAQLAKESSPASPFSPKSLSISAAPSSGSSTMATVRCGSCITHLHAHKGCPVP